jgi:hypothetical protein
MDVELWNELILSKTAPGVYHMIHSINIPVYFPYYCNPPSMHCIQIHESQIDFSQTDDPTRPAWHYAKVEITIDPPCMWELTPDISMLKKPQGLCRVTIRVFDLLFHRFIDTDTERHKFVKTMTVCNMHIATKADITSFLDAPGFQMKYLHTSTKKDLTARIWHDLIKSPIRKNSFAIKLPHMIRVMSDSITDRSSIPSGISVLSVTDDILQKTGFPDSEKCSVGLCSATINLILMHPQSRIIPVTVDLWPDIPHELAGFTKPPNCRIGLYLSDVCFVKIASQKELLAMVGKRAYKIW